jgi:Protein  of unknown function (DUF3018)
MTIVVLRSLKPVSMAHACRLALSADIRLRATSPENRSMPRLRKVIAKRVGAKTVGRKSHIAERTVSPKSASAKRIIGPKRAGPKRAVAKADGLTKFQRFRRRQANKGMKLLRIWVPDPSSPEFAAEAERQAKLLRGRPEEKEAMAFIEAAFEWPDR